MSETPQRSRCTAPGMWPVGEVLGRTQVDHERPGVALERAGEIGGSRQQLRIGVAGHRWIVVQAEGRRCRLDRDGSLRCKVVEVDVSRALDQIAEIHQQIAKGEVYRGYRSLPLAASGPDGARRRLAAAGRARHGRSDRLRAVLDGDRGRRRIRRLQRDHLQLRRPRRRRRPGGRRARWSASSCRASSAARRSPCASRTSARRWCRCCRGSGRSASASARSRRARICRGRAAGSRSSITPPASRCCGSRAARSR